RIAAKIAQLFALLRKIESSTQQYAKLQTLMKSKVLDLAMRGKLVKQDPNDEPASVLLKKIEAEKEQLTKEKKIKKSKPLPPITDKEKPFEIPDSWEWVRLGDIVSSVTKGTTPKGGKKAYVSKGINYYRAENVAISGLGKQNLNHITSDIHNGPLKRSILKENDILITIAGTLGRVTYVKKEDLPGNTNQAVSISRPINSNEINEKFLVYILASSIQRVVKNNKTTSIPNLTLQQIAETIFPFPPLSEQNRIVSKIVRLFTLLKK
ncbi:restriction endonuclease subunit S, partial [Lactobacillus taiwanensis]